MTPKTTAAMPHILGVPMRQCENPIYFELKGVQLCSCDDGRWFYWNVSVVPGFCNAGDAGTLSEAVAQIEYFVTNLRTKLQELGT